MERLRGYTDELVDITDIIRNTDPVDLLTRKPSLLLVVVGLGTKLLACGINVVKGISRAIRSCIKKCQGHTESAENAALESGESTIQEVKVENK